MDFRGANVDLRYSTTNVVSGDQYIVQHESTTQTLRSLLQPVPMAVYGRPECHAGTRSALIHSIIDWAQATTKTHSILWLHALAGAGKSTLSTTIADRLGKANRLGAFLFFDRDDAKRSNPETVMKTLAYQIGLSRPLVGEAMVAILKDSPGILEANQRSQFQRLIIDPLQSEYKMMPNVSPTIVILDALDECGTPYLREVLLETLADMTSQLTVDIRFLITSRPEHDIQYVFENQQHIIAHELDIRSIDNMDDVSSYIRHRMVQVRKKATHLPRGVDWPTEFEILKLSERACGLFVWASTAIQFIGGYDPKKRLDIILRGDVTLKATDALDLLYRTALESVGNWDDEDFLSDFRAVIGLVLVARQPLSSTCIDTLLSVEDHTCLHIISHLGCVVQPRPMVRLLHPSFADFLMTLSRCGREIWAFDAISYHHRVAAQCLSRLEGILRRNMCNMSLPKNIADLADAIIPEDVAYACIFWIDHICATGDTPEPGLIEHIDAFLCRHLLHWFEVMSILKRSRDTIRLLGGLLSWAKASRTNLRSVLELIDDAHKFARTFASSIEEHPLLVYYSALPFTPKSSRIYELYNDTNSLPFLVSGFEPSWSPLMMISKGHPQPVSQVAFSPDGTQVVSCPGEYVRVLDAQSGAEVVSILGGSDAPVNTVAFSPDGTRIASGTCDGEICIWILESKVEVIPNLRRHVSGVNSIAFSPNGTRIVSGSDDRTVRVWDATSGVEVIPTILGHNHAVRSVAYSPDGTRIVSGSVDETVRVWDAISGVEVVAVMEGHISDVLSVAFSPDGTRIISGSSDNTIRVWDAVSGEEAGILSGHTDSVHSVAFSPDGTQIVSGSFDSTIRVWDLTSGTEAFTPLRGHEGAVFSVTFSPDGSRIASGSQDCTVRVWDVESMARVDPTWLGHDNLVSSVAISHDGTRIVSGSWDKTIRLWDAESGIEVVPSLQAQERVASVAFSPSGTRFVSGAFDGTIRLWDVESGAQVVQTMRGHDRVVRSIAFSPSGTRIVSGSEDRSVRLWDVESGIEVSPSGQRKRDHGGVVSVGFSPDGTQIVSATFTNIIRVWDAELRGQLINPMQIKTSDDDPKPVLTSVVFSPDGTQLFYDMNDQTTYVWSTELDHQPYLGPTVNSDLKYPFASFEMNREGWVVHSHTCRRVFKIPSITDRCCLASREDTLVIGTARGKVLIIRIPPALLTSTETLQL